MVKNRTKSVAKPEDPNNDDPYDLREAQEEHDRWEREENNPLTLYNILCNKCSAKTQCKFGSKCPKCENKCNTNDCNNDKFRPHGGTGMCLSCEFKQERLIYDAEQKNQKYPLTSS